MQDQKEKKILAENEILALWFWQKGKLIYLCFSECE